DRLLERAPVEGIDDDGLRAETLEQLPLLVRARRSGDVVSGGHEPRHEGAADHARRPGDEDPQPGRRTVSVSPSTETPPPSDSSSRTATAAPRSRRSAPVTTGLAEAVTGATSISRPRTRTSTVSRPPWRSVAWTSADTPRCTGSKSTWTDSPSPLTLTRSSPRCSAEV